MRARQEESEALPPAMGKQSSEFCALDGQPIELRRSNADVAQLVEQLIRNQQVNGSSPFVGSIFSFLCLFIFHCVDSGCMAVLLWALYRQTRIVAHGYLAAAADA